MNRRGRAAQAYCHAALLSIVLVTAGCTSGAPSSTASTSNHDDTTASAAPTVSSPSGPEPSASYLPRVREALQVLARAGVEHAGELEISGPNDSELGGRFHGRDIVVHESDLGPHPVENTIARRKVDGTQVTFAYHSFGVVGTFACAGGFYLVASLEPELKDHTSQQKDVADFLSVYIPLLGCDRPTPAATLPR